MIKMTCDAGLIQKELLQRSYLVDKVPDVIEDEGQGSVLVCAANWQSELITAESQMMQAHFHSHLRQWRHPDD